VIVREPLPADLKLFEYYVQNTIATAALEIRNDSLAFFYCFANPEFGFKDSIYYIESLETIAVAQSDGFELTLLQLFQLSENAIDAVISSLATKATRKVIFGFTPKNIITEKHFYKEDDLTLFVSHQLISLFEHQQLMVPLLSHT